MWIMPILLSIIIFSFILNINIFALGSNIAHILSKTYGLKIAFWGFLGTSFG